MSNPVFVNEPIVVLISKTTVVSDILKGQDLINFAAKQSSQIFNDRDIKKDLADWGHLSVFEHESFGLFLAGISRGLATELIRHRHLSFTQQSTRYCKQTKYVVPVEYRPIPPDEWVQDIQTIHEIYLKYIGKTKYKDTKQKYELAKQMVPNCAEASLVVTGNLRAWREMLPKRLSKNASLEFQIVAQKIDSILPKLGD